MSEVSANLNHLESFSAAAENIATRLGESIAPERAALLSFVNGAGSRTGPEAMALVTRAEGIRDEITELATFVRLVRDALELADGEAVGGTVTVSSAEMNELMHEAADNAGVDYEGVTGIDEVVEATVPVVGTVDADSGWVGDPVLTATGHFVVAEIDLPMPDRLAVLEWPRTYASTDETDSGLGRGWFSWLNAVAVESTHGVAVTDQTGRTTLLEAEFGTQTRFTAADRSASAVLVDGEYVVRWGRRSTHAYETWRFAADDGRLLEVAGEIIGVTRFLRENGRLVRLAHDGGRAVTLRWSGDRLIGLESTDGRTATFETEGRLLRGVSSPGCTQRYRHDDHGRIDAVVDGDDVTIVEIDYDERGRAIEQREHTGGGSRFEYESPRRTFVSDLDGVRRAGYLHDEQGRVIVATGEPLEPLTRRFDSVGRTVHQSNVDGTGFSMQVEQLDLLDDDDPSTVVEREILTHTGDQIEVFEYDSLERIRRYARNGHVTTYSYRDDSVLPCRVEAAGGWFVELSWEHGCLVEVTDADGVTGRFDYDANGDIVAVTDGVGNRTRFDRHATGCATSVRFADGSVFRAEFDGAGRPVVMVDGAGGEIRFDMSPGHRLIALTDPTGGRVELRYDAAGLPVEIVDAAGHAVEVEVDGEHRPRKITLPDGSTREVERDVAGRVVGLQLTDRSATGSIAREWSIVRDTRQSSVAYVTPGGRTTVFSSRLGAVQSHLVQAGDTERSLLVDALAESSTFVDADGSTWVTQNDRDLRTVSRLAPDGTVATMSYTPAGRIRSLVDAERTTEFGYDEAGRVVTRDEGSGPWRFERDGRGRVAAVESPQGRRQVFVYDAVGRVTKSALGEAITEQEFDLCGRLVRKTFPDGASTAHEWGARGELVTTTDRAGGVTRYEYDARRRMVAMVDPAGGRATVEYAFDGLPAAVTDPAGHRRTFTYDADGHLLEERDGDRTLRYELDEHGRRVGVALQENDDREPLDRIAFGRDARGAVTSVFHNDVALETASLHPSPDLDIADVRVTYDLDGLGLRTQTEGFVRTVRRDAVGRRVGIVDELEDSTSIREVVRDASGTVVAHADGATTTSYAFHPSGFLASVEGADGLLTWDYDAMGRLLVENGPAGRREFRYDRSHRLTEVVGVDGHTRFTYDASGRRTRASGGDEWSYEWDLTGLRARRSEAGLIEFERDAYGRVTKVATPDGVTDIVWRQTSGLPTPLTIGSDVVVSDGASVAALRSPDGSVRSLPAQAGPWGELRDIGPFEVTWHPFHGLTVGGLVVLGARVYDIETRQFLSPDPQRSIVGMASSSWTYCYAANDPVNQLDPLGLAPLSNEEFERIQNRYTRTQWGNIAKVGIIVVGVALMPTGSGAAVFAAGFAIGAASAGGGEIAKQVINNEFDIGQQGYRPGEIVKEAAFGGVLGGGGAWLGGTARMTSLTGPASSFATRAPVNFASGVVESTAVESWDGLGLPGSDGSFDVEEILWGGVASVVGGEISHPHFGDTSATTPDVPPVNRAGADAELPSPSVTPGPTVGGAPDATADIDVPDLQPPATTGDGPVWGLPSSPESIPDPSRPIKGNQDSGIFHEPGGQYYDRTVAEAWFATPDEAIEAGYRPPRR